MNKVSCSSFISVPAMLNSKVTGSGIGLMLVGKLVSLHGGKISVDSVEHQGTTIKIVFPKKNKTSQSISDEASSKFEALAPVLPAPNVPAKTTATIDDPNLRRILVVTMMSYAPIWSVHCLLYIMYKLALTERKH